MAATSMNTLLKRVGEEYDPHFRSSVATGGTNTTLVDSKAANSAIGKIYKFGHITKTAKDDAERHRPVTDYAPGSGTWTVGGGTWTSPTTDAYYAWTRWDPVEIEATANRVLELMEYEEETDTGTPGLVLVDNQRQYALATDFAWVTRPEQVVQVQRRLGTTAAQYAWREVRGWRVTGDQDALTLEFMAQVPAATDTLRIVTRRPFSTLGTYPIVTGAGTSTAPLNWWAWETIVALLKKELQRSPLEGRRSLSDELAFATTRLSQERLKHTPRTRAESVWKAPQHGWVLNASQWGRRW